MRSHNSGMPMDVRLFTISPTAVPTPTGIHMRCRAFGLATPCRISTAERILRIAPATTDTAAVSTMAAACAIPFTEALLRHFADMEGAIWATEALPELDIALASTAGDPGSEPVVFEVAASGAAGVS